MPLKLDTVFNQVTQFWPQEEVPQPGVEPTQRLEKLKALKLLPLQQLQGSAHAPPGLEIQHCAVADDGLFLGIGVGEYSIFLR